MKNNSKLRIEKPIPRMRILNYVKALKVQYFDTQVKKLLSKNLAKQESKVKVLKDKNGKRLIPESNRNVFDSIEEFNSFLAKADFNFKIEFFSKIEERWMELDKDNSINKMQLMYEIIGEGILKWIEELESLETKISSKKNIEYLLFHQELWDCFKEVEKFSKTYKAKLGRPNSKYKTFKDCLNLNDEEFIRFEKALSDYIIDGKWISKEKSDYPSLMEALNKLKFLDIYSKEPFAKAFCNSYNLEFRPAFYRIGTKQDTIKKFITMLKNIRPSK